MNQQQQQIERILGANRGFDILVTIDDTVAVAPSDIQKAIMDAALLSSRGIDFNYHEMVTYDATGAWVADGAKEPSVAIVIQIVPRD